VRQLAYYVTGCRALNVSWDSGLLLPPDPEAEGWTFEQGHAISPVIDAPALESWPYSGGFDEWYFFSRLPADLALIPYCNWGDTSLSDWPSIAGTPTGVNLRRQLRQSQPNVVLGEGHKLFAISANTVFLDEFVKLAAGVSPSCTGVCGLFPTP
jgi:hypothetical protein